MIQLKPKDNDKTGVDLVLLADSVCRYDLDQLDVYWLQEINEQRLLMGKVLVMVLLLIESKSYFQQLQ